MLGHLRNTERDLSIKKVVRLLEQLVRARVCLSCVEVGYPLLRRKTVHDAGHMSARCNQRTLVR